MTRYNRLYCLIAATLVACGGTPPNDVDSGAIPGDGGTNDTGAQVDGGHDGGGGTGSVCDSPMAVTLAAGMHTVTGDTTGHSTGVVDLGAMCGGQAAGGTTAPQQVIAITLPGTASDMVTVAFTLLTDGTNAMFDTTTQLRTSCADATGAMCFDDSAVEQDYRSDGVFNAPGGSTRYLIIGGYRMPEMGYVNVGPWQADFTTYVNPVPPTFTSGTAVITDGDDLRVTIMGMDAQGAASDLQYSFLDSAGAPIGLDIDMMPTTPDVTDLDAPLFPSPAGMTTFTSGIHIVSLHDYPQIAAMAQTLRVSIYSATGLTSAPEAMIPITHATTVHAGEACDATHVCAAGVDCTASVCVIPAAVLTECAGATPLTIVPPTTTTTSASTTLNFTTGMGLLEGSCVGTGGMGDEHIVSVTVPATGTFDLIAETPDMGTMGFDSLVYDRTTCGDPSTETACNDDRSVAPDPHVLASLITVQNAAPGVHYVVVDSFETLMASASTMLTVHLRPVLDSAAVCDPTGVMNRCHAAACPTTGTAVCP